MSIQQHCYVHPLPPEYAELISAAVEARGQAYAPYSGFPVGAAIRTRSGRIFFGCNIENAAFGATMCAERVAIFSAIAAGERSFSELALVADQATPLSPCGTCRQVLAELAPELVVIMANMTGQVQTGSIRELLPLAFHLPAERSAADQ